MKKKKIYLLAQAKYTMVGYCISYLWLLYINSPKVTFKCPETHIKVQDLCFTQHRTELSESQD